MFSVMLRCPTGVWDFYNDGWHARMHVITWTVEATYEDAQRVLHDLVSGTRYTTGWIQRT